MPQRSYYWVSTLRMPTESRSGRLFQILLDHAPNLETGGGGIAYGFQRLSSQIIQFTAQYHACCRRTKNYRRAIRQQLVPDVSHIDPVGPVSDPPRFSRLAFGFVGTFVGVNPLLRYQKLVTRFGADQFVVVLRVDIAGCRNFEVIGSAHHVVIVAFGVLPPG